MDKRLIFSVLLVMLSVGTYAQNNTTSITNAECGTKQLCVAQPPLCDPSVAGSCFFLGVKKQTGQNFTVDLSGESDGYIAVTVTGGAGEGDPTYACVKSNGKVIFFSLIFKNGVLNNLTLSVNSVNGRVNGKTIQCSFLATVPVSNTNATNLTISVSTGTYNDTDGSVGPPNTVIKVSNVDLENPNITLTNGITTTSTTVAPTPDLPSLSTNITRTECGSSKLCAAEPSGCDPAAGGRCYFIAAKKQTGQNFAIDLSGESDGYIAVTLIGGAGEGDPTYACAKSSGKVKLFSSILKNGVLNNLTLNVNSVNGRVNGKTIQCSFFATVPVPKTRATNVNFSVSTGTYNDTDLSVGPPNAFIKVSNVDLENPNITLTNEITNTATTVAPTPGGAGVLPSLSTTITRKDCGSSKLCAAEPSGCDPATGDNCFFLSVKQQSGQIYNFELSGQSDGYVAAGLSITETQNGNHIAYICAKSNDAVKFFTGTIQNLVLNTNQTQNTSKEQGKVNGRTIQCIFTADVPNTARAASYALSVSNGTYDGTNLGIPKFLLLTRLANLSDPTANLTNLLNYAPSLLTPTHSFLSALLINACIIAFTAM